MLFQLSVLCQVALPREFPLSFPPSSSIPLLKTALSLKESHAGHQNSFPRHPKSKGETSLLRTPRFFTPALNNAEIR